MGTFGFSLAGDLFLACRVKDTPTLWRNGNACCQLSPVRDWLGPPDRMDHRERPHLVVSDSVIWLSVREGQGAPVGGGRRSRRSFRCQ